MTPSMGTINNARFEQIAGFSQLVVDATNVVALGNNLSAINLVFPYGFSSLPPDGCQGILIPIGGSSKSYKCIGFAVTSPAIPHEFDAGESWLNSQRYILAMQNDAIRAYRQGDEDFNTTLPNGESFVEMMINRINDLQTTIDGINENYSILSATFNSHQHPGGSPTGAPTTSLTQDDLATTPEMAYDLGYLNDGKALIDDLGENYG